MVFASEAASSGKTAKPIAVKEKINFLSQTELLAQ
tara:strand:+ start:384 stop:488 length:105 start_codon:yes stop_codon:yes gene_type:complete